jgi:hypothetical protein
VQTSGHIKPEFISVYKEKCERRIGPAYFRWTHSTFLASAILIMFETGYEYSYLGLTKVQCSNNKEEVVE